MRLAGCAESSLPKTLPAIFCSAVVVIVSASGATAQSVPYERTYPQSKTVVEKHLKELQSSSAGNLPVLAGFTVPGDRPLNRFQRGYYQCVAQVTATPSGGSLVRVSATITAWYTDPASARSGYQMLPSNGRLEADFLDRLQRALSGQTSPAIAAPVTNSLPAPSKNRPQPALSAPSPGSSLPGAPAKGAGSPFKLGDPFSMDQLSSLATQKAVIDRHAEEQEKEVKGLEEILRNQAHPSNLVAVKKRDTPVLSRPSEDAKILFLAAAEDEFEILDTNASWVHIRISGLSRGWIRRSGVEMPADSDTPPVEPAAGVRPAATSTQPFNIENEQVASFPGTWEPLQGKTVRIVSVQKASDSAAATGSAAKLQFAKSLLDRQYADLAKTSSSILGVVVIFDSEDGGMLAATVPALRQWKIGALSDEAFWRRCFFDPPEAFGLAAKRE